MIDFGNILKQLRTERNLTQSELAEKLGLSKSSISMYENGKREPDFENLEMIADFFNVRLMYLIGAESRETTTPSTSTQKVELQTLAAHALEDLTEEEQLKIIEFAKFIKSQRTPDGK